MASRIQTLLDQILNAVYGEEVRGSIHDAIQECYSDVSTAKTASDDATSAANTAASNANSKASAAQNAATNANDAAAAATQAKENADTATENANAAASSADSAASNANQARVDAETATSNANDAAINANSKSTLANDAATAANNAAVAAIQAKENADTATSNANTATNSANNAATNANTAASNANSKADQATLAAQNANEKATTADLAAANANNAASIANTSATGANNAADAANQAKANADAATAKANDAATAATNAASSANSAATNANGAASDAMVAITETQTATYNANVATQNATRAVTRANTVAEMIEGMTVDSEDVGPNGVASASISVVSGHKHIHFVLKQGATGAPYIIKGNVFPTVGALEESITSPSIGDQYNVGTEPPYNIYRWTGTTWEDQGKIGIAVSELSNSEIDTIWNGTAISSLTRKYLDHNGLFHLVVNKIKALFNTKVDKVEGMGLSHNDFVDEYIEQLDNHESQLVTLSNSKVDKMTGKALSTNDFTTVYKDRIDQNKIDIAGLNSSKVDKVNGKGLSTNDFTTAYKNQIDQNKINITEVTKRLNEIRAEDIGAVPNTRKVNEKALSEDISLTAEDVGALPLYGTAVEATKLESKRKFIADLNSSDKASFDGTEDVLMGVTGTLPIENGGTGATNAEQALLALGAVSMVNKKAADKTGEITLSCEDIGAIPDTRKVNEKALITDITITAADVGAIPNKANAVTPSLLDRSYAELDANGKVKPELISAIINEYNASHTLEAKDAGAEVLMYCATPMTVTIPTQDTVNFPQWTEIEIIRFGTADLTIAGAEGVTIFSAGNKRQIAEMYDVVSIKKTYMNNWLLVGNLK